MGSTSYDEARDPTDATWSGASWYGPSTGEYWIVNPREYADPRKHGPGYQERARRPLGGQFEGQAEALADAEAPPAEAAFAAPGAAPAPGSGDVRAPEPGAARPRGSAAARAPGPGTPRAHNAGAGAAARAARVDRSRRWGEPSGSAEAWGRDGAVGRAAGPGDTGAGRDRGGGLLGASPREWVGGPADDPIRRLGIALIAWPPIGLAAAAAIGDITGCTTYSAGCTGAEPLLPWLAQAGILGLLLLLPPVARLLAGGAIGVLAALVPITFFLIAVGGSGEPEAGFALAALLGIAWLAGIAWAAAQLRRRGGDRGGDAAGAAGAAGAGGDPARAGS